MNANEIQSEALSRAVNSPSMSNYPAIFAGFMAKGIPEDQIKPRENIFSFQAWKALGRSVKKGEHGVRIATVRKGERTERADDGTETKVGFSSPWHVTVFHVSQTDAIGERREIKPEAGSVEHRDTEQSAESRKGFHFGGFINKDAPKPGYYSDEFTPIK